MLPTKQELITLNNYKYIGSLVIYRMVFQEYYLTKLILNYKQTHRFLALNYFYVFKLSEFLALTLNEYSDVLLMYCELQILSTLKG
jgi:hypothetical protein